MNQPIRDLKQLGEALAASPPTPAPSPFAIKDLGRISVTRDRINYDGPNPGIFEPEQRYRYYWERDGRLRVIAVNTAAHGSYSAQDQGNGRLRLQMARGGQLVEGMDRWPPLCGPTSVVTFDVDGKHSIFERGILLKLSTELARSIVKPGRLTKDRSTSPPIKPPLASDVQGFRERLKAAQDVLNAAKTELGEDMQMRLDDQGQLRVTVMLEI